MPTIQDLNATNSSFVLQYGKYIDFNTWIAILGTAVILILVSRYLPGKDDVGRFLIATLAFIFAVAAIWGSLGVAHLDYTHGATVIANNSDINQSITYDYVYPVQQVVSSTWLTVVCILIAIFSFLNALDIFMVMMQRPEVDEKKKGGRGMRI
jgi:hypothetical protein